MTTVVILGATGFIGSNLLKEIAKVGNCNIKILVRNIKTKKNISKIFNNNVEVFEGDISNVNILKKNIDNNCIVINLTTSSVPYSSMQNPLQEINNHLVSQIKLIEVLNKIGVKKIVYTSSGGGIYGINNSEYISESEHIQPHSPHAITKIAIEYYLHYFYKIYQVPYLVYRISNPYGPGQKQKEGFGLIPSLINNIKNKTKPILYGNGKLIRDFIYIDDLVKAITLSFPKNTKFNTYNLGTGEGTSIAKIWKILKEISKTKLDPSFKDIRPIDAKSVVLDISRFKNEFNWSPKINITKGLRLTYSK
jgi:UDP-glucose 4-epimerase